MSNANETKGLTDKVLHITGVDPVELYGVNDQRLEKIRAYFPTLKLIARGETLKVRGLPEEIVHFESRLNQLIQHTRKYGRLSDELVKKIMEKDFQRESDGLIEDASGIIVYGNNGLVVKARTPNQLRIVQSALTNDMVFAVGPAGTGKTYTAVALAVKAPRDKEVRRIILTRPAVEAGENLGFLPGDLKEKLDPYLQPLYDALQDMLPGDKLTNYLETGIIQIAPLAFMRGRTLDNAFVILDEAQNATESQLKMFLTRMGRSAKFLITGDLTQIDLPKNQPSGLIQAVKLLANIKGIDIIYLDTSDVIRHHLVTSILHAYQGKQQDGTQGN
jgi:phosphate starvation-inducible protein PhoH and related proteins